MAADPPAALRVRVAAGVLVRDDGRLLVGGVPLRLVRLSPRGGELARAWRSGAPVGGAGGLARRLLDAGILDACPDPADAATSSDVAVVIPVRDRADRLARCLAALRASVPAIPVTVVDDGSADGGGAVAAVAAAHGAAIVRHAVSRGPAAARNTGLGATRTPLVAFVDSDVVVDADDRWLRVLAAHFRDPRIGAVAPRVRALDETSSGLLAGYERRHASLDMGAVGGLVAPGRPLSYVPATTLIVRRAAMPAGGFAEALHLGEDVDLCWRMDDAGVLVRYEPAVSVRHDHRVTPVAFATRRLAYAGSIGPLAQRHPRALPALRADPAMAAAVGLLAARRPVGAATAAAVALARVTRWVAGASDRPVPLAAELTGRGLLGTAHGFGHALRRVWSPLLLVPGPHRRAGWPLLAAAYALRLTRPGAPRRPADVAMTVVDDLLATAGTWHGALRARTATPLLPAIARPSIRRRPARRERPSREVRRPSRTAAWRRPSPTWPWASRRRRPGG
ncbi:MAG TPA: mycofactocin biosynthesis glycosyltransferase MftF [Baekduia sp.]|uniref:mycofactocin biosynthesis glycosyltransferase MftF n=1 Tax=Baekduia sp. TaxID=2600305 RepID=UPI002D78E791|nr:mycofactocin biosynthesis glycosyltransferase MftF [Baekduia sp.]HET6506961.1 mycofactocin biosynthesis glycosyltransferase MftF [Baekduia sp.]